MEKHRADLVPVRDFGRDLVFEVVPGSAEVDPEMNAVLRVPAPGPVIEIDVPESVSVGGLRFHHGAAPRVPIERVEILKEGGSGFEILWSSPPEWPALTELVSGLLATPRDGTQTLLLSSGNPSLSGRLQLRLYGLDSEPPELTEIEVLSARPTGDP
jgi:hypothetical protein